MITLIFQIFLWLLAAFLLGLLLGWFISPFFCKKGGTRTSNAGDHSFINRPSGQGASVSDTGLRTDNDGQRIAATNDASPQGHNNADSANGSSLKTNAAAATGIAAAGAAAYAASKSADDKKAAEAAAKAEIDAKRAARARQEAKLAEAEQAQRDAAAIHKKQSSKLAAEHAEAERVEAQKRAAAEAAKQQTLEEAKLAEQQAAAKKEADRIAAEKAETDRLIEAKRLADEKLEAEIEADRLRLIEEQRQRDAAEAAKLAEEKRIADEIEADRLKLAEQQRLADEQEARATKAAEAERIAEEKRVADEKAEVERLAEEKHKSEEAEATRIAVEKAEAERLAEEKRKAEEAEAARVAAEKAEAERLATEQRIADEAEAARIAAEKAEAERIAEEKRLEKAEAERLAEEKRKAEEAEAARIEAEKVEAERVAEVKRIADERAEAERLATEKRIADEADVARIEAEKAQAEAARIATEKAEAEAAETAKSSNTGAIAAAGIASIAAAAGSAFASEETSSNLDAYADVDDNMRPARLASPNNGKADDLKEIRGIGPAIEKTLNTEGVYHFQQVADFTPQNAMWVDEHISFPGRIHREDWIGQAKCLVDGSEYKGHASMMAAELEDDSDNDDSSSASASSKVAGDSAALASAAAVSSSEDNKASGSASASSSTYDLENVTDDMRPARLAKPTSGKADDLKEIRGIGPVIEKTLNSEGVYHYQQIADFTPDNVRWVDKNISIPGRVDRDDWIGQAKSLAAGDTYQGFAYDPDIAVITDDMRPEKLASPRGGAADDLKRIKGIGPVIETTLNGEGIYHFQQIAGFTPQNTMWVDKHISFPGRIHREDWIGQAKSIIDGREYIGHAFVSADDDSSADAITDDMRPARGRLKPNQKADDLKVINGIGPVIEESLNDEGVYFYQQIADFSDENARWVDNHMAFPGRIHREDWIGQAKILVGDTSATVSDNMKPTLLSKPGAGGAEDLKRIKGIGKVLEKRLHKLGIYHYEQIADLSADNVIWLNDFVSFPEGRIESEDWVGQAKLLADGKRTDYSDRFDGGETPYK